MATNKKQIQALKDWGINEPDHVLSALLLKASGNVEKAISNYYEKGSTKLVVPSSSLPTIIKKLSTPSRASLNQNLPPVVHSKSNFDWHFLGRRNIVAYSLKSGYLLRSCCLRFDLQVKAIDKPTIASKKDKFSGAKLIFETYHMPTVGYDEYVSKVRNIQGRISNVLADFIVPLLEANLIQLRGHISYDMGSLNTFQDIPVSLHIYARKEFFELASDAKQSKEVLFDYEQDLPRSNFWTSNIDLASSNFSLKERRNMLLMWLAEGESGLALMKEDLVDKSEASKATASHCSAERPSAVTNAPLPGSKADLGDDDEEEGGGLAAVDNEPDADGGDTATPTINIDDILQPAASTDVTTSLPPVALPAQPPAIALTMRPYQLHAMQWMIRREEEDEYSVAAAPGGARNGSARGVLCGCGCVLVWMGVDGCVWMGVNGCGCGWVCVGVGVDGCGWVWVWMRAHVRVIVVCKDYPSNIDNSLSCLLIW